MPFDFPAAPPEGQEFAPPGGPTYVYASPAWKVKTGIPSKMQVIIADTAPPGPTAGLLWWESDSGRLFIWYDDGNTQQWVQVSGIGPTGIADAPADSKTYARKDGTWVDLATGLGYVAKTGDTMTGGLTISDVGGTSRFYLNKSGSGFVAQLLGQTSGKNRWALSLGNGAAETGSGDAGSDFAILNHNDAGVAKGTPLTISRADGQATFTGDLTISKSSPYLNFDRSDATSAVLMGKKGGLNRWAIVLSSGVAESGGNAGSYFDINRYNDDGSFIGTFLRAYRHQDMLTLAKGQVQFPATANPSSDANTLDEYREGTWVPDLRFGGGVVGITYASRTGSYVKVGRHVTVACRVTLSSKGTSTGIAYLYGLPFAANEYSGLTLNYYGALANLAAGSVPAPLVNPSAVFWDFRVSGQGVNSGNMSDTHFTNTSDFIVSGSYIATS